MLRFNNYPVTEKDFMAQVRSLADAYGWLVYHPFDSRRSTSGYPDLTMVRDGRLIYAELKTEKGRMTDAQTLWLNTLARCSGVETYLWRPSELQHIADILARHGG